MDDLDRKILSLVQEIRNHFLTLQIMSPPKHFHGHTILNCNISHIIEKQTAAQHIHLLPCIQATRKNG